MNEVVHGINLRHDTSAAIVADGVLVCAAEEERFDGIRHTTRFPTRAIDFCLSRAGVARAGVTAVAVTWDYRRFLFNAAPFEGHTIAHDDTTLMGLLRRVRTNFGRYTYARKTLREHGFGEATYVRHHLAHAVGAFYSSGYEDANVMVIDGRGERESTSLFAGHGLHLQPLESYPVDQSLGHLYTYATWLAGLYRGLGNEGKTMGLAGYGTGAVDFSEILQFGPERYVLDRKAMRRLRPLKVPEGEFSETAKEIAFGAQKALEQAVVFLGTRMYRLTGMRRFAISGGVTLNCNSNSALLAEPFVDHLFIQPAANDAGTAVGAAMHIYAARTGNRPVVNGSHVYLGPSFTAREIEEAILKSGLKYTTLSDVARAAAEAIASGKVIAWFQGPMEFGPRALGARSILATATNTTVRDKVNTLKRREQWRPLAPVVTADALGDWFTPASASPYMLLTQMVREDKRSKIPGATHVDGTARLQSVTREMNPLLYQLLRELDRLTGIPVALNTSLNTKGDPIACTPSDALRCLRDSGLDALFIGDYCVYPDGLPLASRSGVPS